MKKGAEFSTCGKYRYSLWRIWDDTLPKVMFIGLNPSTANGDTNDPTIESVIRIAKTNGFGGFYMMNCWAYISTDPDKLKDHRWNDIICNYNDWMLALTAKQCEDVVFAWGNFRIVKESGRERELLKMFPDAKCICKNKNGSPGHPLFKKGDTRLINW